MQSSNSFYTSLVLCLLLPMVWSYGQQERMEFYFDYRVEYAYSTPTIPNGTIIVLYNSEDKYAAFTHISPYMTDESVLVGFSDGSNIFFSKEAELKEGFIRPASMPNRLLNDDKMSMDAGVFWDYVKPTGKEVDIAGYLATEFSGTLDDYSKRTIWISEESFDARTLHTPFTSDIGLFPLPLVEADYIRSDQFLLGSEIQLENGTRYSLTVTYLEYELNKINFSDYYIRSTGDQRHLAATYNGASSLLRQSKYTAWKNYDKMGGLEYEPRRYDFDKKLTYRYVDTDGQDYIIEAYFNTEHEFCGIKSNYFKDGLDFVLGFKNGVFIAYYKDQFTELMTEAIFFEPSGGTLHLDHPTYLSWATAQFNQKWIAGGGAIKVLDYTSESFKVKSGLDESIYLSPVQYDPRTIYMDYHLHLESYPSAFTSAALCPPGQLLTKWEYRTEHYGNSNVELIKSENVSFHYSDLEVPEFNRVKN